MKSHSNHFTNDNNAGGPSKRNGKLNNSDYVGHSALKTMSIKGQELYNKAANEKLKNHIKELYRPGATIGDGGTADALREELQTGKNIAGKSHLIKAKERLKALEKLNNNSDLSTEDKKIIKELIDDLKDALKGGSKK